MFTPAELRVSSWSMLDAFCIMCAFDLGLSLLVLGCTLHHFRFLSWGSCCIELFLSIYVGLTKNILNLQADEELLSELEADVREECIKFGPVDNVKVRLPLTRRFSELYWKTDITNFVAEQTFNHFNIIVRHMFYTNKSSKKNSDWHALAVTHLYVTIHPSLVFTTTKPLLLTACFFMQVCENHPQGVILVKFKDRKDGAKCIEKMNGRW